VAKATFAALGGSARGFLTNDVSGLDGAELDLLVISEDLLDRRSRPLTGNVVLWPKPQTIVMNREAFSRLTLEQRDVLRRAGHEALVSELERDARDNRQLGSLLCSEETLRVATATTADRAALRRAVEPVYRSLERDPSTRAWIAQITRMRRAASTGTDEVRCP
jgi:TRAP-type C4-dicarboxylate transport system substrate-binding protein